MKQSIKSRKDAIFAAYDVKGELLKKTEALFLEMEKLGASCKDVGDFEAKLAASPLNQQYLNLFTEIATKSVRSDVAKGAAIGAVKSAAEQALRNVVPTRAAVNQKITDKLRGLGL